MPTTAKKKATYEDLYNIPENMIGEIIDGELFLSPRPSPKHSRAASRLQQTIGGPYDLGQGGGPGGWTILFEPELRLGKDVPLVPDLAGWKRERLPELPEENWISVSPDWICEVLSPSTVRVDRVKKMPKYAQAGVPFLWMIDPANKALDVFKLESGKWVLASSYVEDDKVHAEPFQEMELELALLWA
jgi:Uma2 family endonuclease